MNKPMATGTDSERTRPHRRVEQCLDDMGISYMSEYDFPPYRVDVYLPEWHLGVEIDGPYHNKKRDNVRDLWLFQWLGLKMLRIDAVKWKSKDKLKLILLKFIEEQCGEAEERKALWRSHSG
jgi:very-short-patch-repair endonuclease